MPKGSVVRKYEPGSELQVLEHEEQMSEEEFAELSEEEQRLSRELERVKKIADDLDEQLRNFSSECAQHPTASPAVYLSNELDQKIKIMEAEFLSLQQEFNELLTVPGQDGDEDEEDFGEDCPEYDGPEKAEADTEKSLDGFDDEELKQAKEAVAKTRNERRLCKKLYLKIAGRTHPDKTNDAVLNAMFLEAKGYFDRMMLNALMEMWVNLQGDRKSIKDRIKAKVARLREKIDEQHGRLNHMSCLGAFELYQFSKKMGLGAAAYAYRSILNNQNTRKTTRVKNLEMDIRQFRAQLEKIRAEKGVKVFEVTYVSDENHERNNS